MLPLPDQLYVAYERTFHPEVSPALLAEHMGVSRATVYNVVERVSDALQPHKRGPKPADCTAALEAENRFLYEYIAALEADLRESIRVTEQRTEDFVLTAGVLGVPLRRIGELHHVAFDRALSKDAAKGILDRYQPVARDIFQGLQPAFHAQVTALAADEIFMGHAPVLAGVELESMAWVLVQRAEHRDGATWQAQLEPFEQLTELVSDRGTGLLAARERLDTARHAAGTAPLHHQADLFHFKRDRDRVRRQLEAAAYRAIEHAEDRRRKVARVRDKRGHATALAKVQQQTAHTLERFDRVEQACQTMDAALELFDAQGVLRRPEHTQTMMQAAVAALKTADEPRLQPILRQAQAPTLWTFLTLLWARLEALALPPELLSALTFLWFYQERATDTLRQTLGPQLLLALLTVRKASAEGCPVAGWAQQIDALLTRVWRASSLIEAMNSLLRGYQNNKKHVSEEFLYLCAVYHNLRRFRHGKRKGRSPLEMLGITVPCQNWLHLLRHPELVKQIGTSKR